jgi:hypothetical protein
METLAVVPLMIWLLRNCPILVHAMSPMHAAMVHLVSVARTGGVVAVIDDVPSPLVTATVVGVIIMGVAVVGSSCISCSSSPSWSLSSVSVL